MNLNPYLCPWGPVHCPSSLPSQRKQQKGLPEQSKGRVARGKLHPQNSLLSSEDAETLGPSEMRSLEFCDGGEELCLVIKCIHLPRGLKTVAVKGCCAPQMETQGAELAVAILNGKVVCQILNLRFLSFFLLLLLLPLDTISSALEFEIFKTKA